MQFCDFFKMATKECAITMRVRGFEDFLWNKKVLGRLERKIFNNVGESKVHRKINPEVLESLMKKQD